MEKASTPRNRLTRSSAKQVNTPKNVEQDDSAERNIIEEVKSSARKSRRRLDSKTKTNGDACVVENTINNEDNAGDSINDKSEHEILNVNNKSQDSQKNSPELLTTSPIISRKSLRTRRSTTPGPELESSASKKMTRSSSYGKLESVSTPTNRRGRRATSESKDFTFTPSKDKITDDHQDSNSKYVPNHTVRIFEKIVEVNEGDKFSEDEGETQKPKTLIHHHKEGKDIAYCENNEQSNTTQVNQTCVKELDLSAHPEIMVNDDADLKLHDSSSQEICNGVEIVDVSENDPEVPSMIVFKEEDVEETNVITKSEEEIASKMPCSLSEESEKLPNDPTKSQKRIDSPDKGAKENEIVDPSKSIKNNSTDSSISHEEKNNLPNTDQPHDETYENLNPHCQILELDASEEINHDDSVKTEIVSVKDVEVEQGDCKQFEVSMEKEEESPETIESSTIVAEGIQDGNEQDICDSENYIEKDIESDNNGCNDMPPIQLIDSSDSEDCNPDQKSDTVELKEYENENFRSTADNNTHKNKALNENMETKRGVDHLNLTTETGSHMIDVNMKDDLNQEKMTKEGPNCVDDLSTMTLTTNNIEITSDDQRDVVENDVSENGSEAPPLNYMGSEPSIESNNIINDNQPALKIEGMVQENSPDDVEDITLHETFSQDQSPVLDEVNKQIDMEEKQINNEYDIPRSRMSNESNVNSDKGNNVRLDKNEEADENYVEDTLSENEEVNKSDEGSCDIYKGLSDSGSDIDEKAEGSQSGESFTSEINSGSGESEEEYVTSADGDEEVKTEPLNYASLEDLKRKDFVISKDGKIGIEKNPDSPMTYDKALAIINKNRVKKIDDEEFLDMFTQELNRVSEQSGSDSDVAIVDEYLMEPEEPTKKNQPKCTTQNSKQPPRPSGPAPNSQTIPPESFPGNFSQSLHAEHGTDINQHGLPIPSQHNHPAMQRINFPQGSMYQQYDQSLHLRGQMMYNQYGHPSSSMQDPHMFNPPMTHSDFSSGMLYHPSVSDPSFPPNSSPLKVRSLANINSGQSSANKSYNKPDETAFDDGTFEHHDGMDNYMNSTSVAQAHNIDDSSNKKMDESTPILNILGLDKESLKLLKKALGLDLIKKKMKTNLEWQKHCLERSILRSAQRKRGQKLRNQYKIDKSLEESDSSSVKASSDQSSEESSQSSSGISKAESHSSSSVNENREVSIEDGSVFVTLKRKSRHRNKRNFPEKKSFHSVNENQDKVKKSRSLRTDLGLRKMPQKQLTEVKSQSGMFVVNTLSAASQSSDSEIVSSDERLQVKSMKRKLKQDLATGKNKLSNMFSQHTSKKVKRTVIEPVLEGPLRKGKSKGLGKLSTDILETLAKEEKKKKRPRPEESSSEEIEKPKNTRKKMKKMKLKSKAGDQNYIPCVTGGATEFGLSRLDKDGTLTLAEKAAKFRTDQLYGASVKRITILDFKHQLC